MDFRQYTGQDPDAHRKGNEIMEENREKPIIRLEGLGKQFQTSGGPVTALEDINL